MTSLFSNQPRIGPLSLFALSAAQMGAIRAVWAQQPPPAAPAAPAPAAPAGPTAMANPSMAGPLVANPDPWHLDVTPFFGPMYVSGAASILGLAQTDPIRPGPERTFMGDIRNAQPTLQTTQRLC